MPDRINHLAVWIAAIVYFLFGWIWYGLLFGNTWVSLMHKSPADMQAAGPTIYIGSFLLGLILSYATAIALSRRPEDLTVSQGISFAIFMGLAVYGTQTLNNTLYAQQPIGLWLINTGYVVIGFAFIGAVVGGWRKRAAA